VFQVITLIHANYREYSSWLNMKHRCYSTTVPEYKYYGARGIKVQQSWWEFKNFLRDMGKRPAGQTLDRIDNLGHYTKENCRWATVEEQSFNNRRTIKIKCAGKVWTLSQIANICGVSSETVRRWSLTSYFKCRVAGPGITI
jgi:hypothetical protein